MEREVDREVLHRFRGEDITGMRSGKLMVLGPSDQTKRGARLWRCRCDCGGEILTEAYRIRRQTVQSCGCTRTEKKIKDITGRRFGRLVALYRLDKKRGSNYLWQCQCDCGKTYITTANSLLSGNTKSCGCGRVDAMKKTLKSYGTVANHVRLVDGTSVDLLERKGLKKNNTSGYTGVQARGDRWIAVITFKRKPYYLGIYSDIEDAIRARKQAEEQLFGEFLNWYYETHPKAGEKSGKKTGEDPEESAVKAGQKTGEKLEETAVKAGRKVGEGER